jgi:2-polyprenyl-3-methyl-5-hydroxy-6-metoxy-1,4-benzoquinol methylase
MNHRELRFLSAAERQLPEPPLRYLLKVLGIKLRRHAWGKYLDRNDRMVWTVEGVSDADGPAANVRNYLERRTLRAVLANATGGRRFQRACEIGCGYGRLIMVLEEFAHEVTGFEREAHLVDVARTLLPDIEFECVESLPGITDLRKYDFAMTCTVLQHLTDAEALEVCGTLRRLAPEGYVLCVEKTEANRVTATADDPRRFISRARAVAMYEEMMAPFKLVLTKDRVLEPTYDNPRPGTCMLFAAPDLRSFDKSPNLL